MSNSVLVKTLADLSLDSGYIAGEASLSTCGRSGQSQPPSSAPRRCSWWQQAGSLYSRNGSSDSVSSTLPEDAADALSKCPCLPELEECPWTERELWCTKSPGGTASPRRPSTGCPSCSGGLCSGCPGRRSGRAGSTGGAPAWRCRAPCGWCSAGAWASAASPPRPEPVLCTA